MKKMLMMVAVAVAIMGATALAHAQVFVNGYFRSNGTYVSPYMRSAPDGNPYNNYSYGR